MGVFDTHAHYDDERFDADRDALLAALPGQGVELVLSAGSDMASSRVNVELAGRYDYLYAAVGVHPHSAKDFREEDLAQLESWAAHPKVKAIGEIGLDYHYDFSPRAVQQDVLRRQMRLAQKVDLPIVFHDREAHADSLAICREIPVRGVFHCFSGSVEMARELLEMGYYLSFTGAITFKGARRALETIAMMPPERIMIETDAPYLTPVPYRGRRNDSTYVHLVAETIAQVRGMRTEQVIDLTRENGRRFFAID